MRRARAAAVAFGRRPMLTAVVLYAVVSVVMVGPGLVPGRTLSSSDFLWSVTPFQGERPAGVKVPGGSNFELADTAAAFQPFTQRARATLPQVALWNPDIGLGHPLLGDMQSAIFSPFSVPSYVLPYWWSLGLVAALKMFVAALGTFVLARALGIRFAGSLLAGLAFGLSFWMVTWLAWPLSSVWALMPWLLVAVDRVVRRPDAPGVAWLAVAGALSIVAGHPESTFHAMLAAVAFGLLRLSRADGERVKRAGYVVLGLVAAAGLAAIVWLPFLELVDQSIDLARRGHVRPGHLPPHNLWGLLFPEYFGRPTHVETQLFINQRSFYCGALSLLLAFVAVLRPTRERLCVAGAGVVAAGVIFGVFPFYELAVHTPALDRTLLQRGAVFICLALALLAGWGLDDVLSGYRRRRAADRRDRWLAPALALIVLVPAVVVAVHNHARVSFLGDAVALALGLKTDEGLSDLGSLLPTASAIAWLLFAGLGATLIVLTIRGRIRPPIAAMLAIALVAVDLLRFGIGENPSIPVDHAQPPATAAVRLLQARTPARFVGLYSPRGGAVPPLPADNGMAYGLQDARAYDYPVIKRYDKLWKTVAPPVAFAPPTTLASSTPAALRTLSLLGVSSLLQNRADPPLTDPGLRLIHDGTDGRVYDNTRALPRAWVVDRQRLVRGENAQLRAVQGPGFRPASEVVVGERLPGVSSAAAPAAAVRARPARIDHYGADRVTLTTTTPHPAVVVLSDVFYPGWHATVDGHDAPVHRVDYLLRGVTVGAGTHRVQFTYRPASYRIGWIISALTAIALAAAVWHSRRTRRRAAT